MPVQTYCTRDDIEALIGPPSVDVGLDRDQDGALSAYEDSLVDTAISNAALKINNMVRHQYKLSDVTNNEWLTYANAVLALNAIRGMGGNPSEPSVTDEYQEVMDILREVRWGRDQLPEQSPSFDHTPTTSAMQSQLGNRESPIIVNPNQSTGLPPVGGRRRITSFFWGYF